MESEKGISLVALVITIIVLLALTGIFLGFILETNNIENNNQANIVKQEDSCNHDWVITSKYDWLRETYKTISKCSKCGKEIE